WRAHPDDRLVPGNRPGRADSVGRPSGDRAAGPHPPGPRRTTMTWTTLHLRTVTPLFSGEDPARQDADSLIRVPAIRGVLRYWFRAVAAGHGITNLVTLWTEEESVFGSTRSPSPIALRTRTQPTTIRADAGNPEWAVHPDPKKFHG